MVDNHHSKKTKKHKSFVDSGTCSLFAEKCLQQRKASRITVIDLKECFWASYPILYSSVQLKVFDDQYWIRVQYHNTSSVLATLILNRQIYGYWYLLTSSRMISFDAYVDQMCAYSIDEQSNAYLIHEYLFPVRIRQGK